MSFIRDRNLPIISFFGRPGDPRKGISSFLDALTFLARADAVPAFAVWIVGGSDGEIGLIEQMLGAWPEVAALHVTGRLILWGRVAGEALPELYSRSSVVVVPSTREQFGIVAVEAMLCGVPVIASNTGGLAHIVLHAFNGTLTDVDAPLCLANAILGYLRNPERVRREGARATQWAHLAFGQKSTYARFPRVYMGLQPGANFPTRASLRSIDLTELRNRAENALGRPLTVEDLSSSDHTSARATADGQSYFCKLYRAEPSDHVSVLPLEAGLRRERTLLDYAGRLAFHADNPNVPRVVRQPRHDDPLAIFEWCEPLTDPDPIDAFRSVARGFRAYRPLTADDGDAAGYLEALRIVAAAGTPEAIAAHDMAAARLNARLSAERPRFEVVHPCVELLRMRTLLLRRTWALRADVVERFNSAMSFVLDRVGIPVVLPQLCHSTLKRAHLLRNAAGVVVACDTDGSRYVTGPFDEVHDVWVRVTEVRGFGASSALSRLTNLLDDEISALPLAVAWLLVQLVFDALCVATLGRDPASTRTMSFCRELPYIWRKSVTR
jgi:hypothetical protein